MADGTTVVGEGTTAQKAEAFIWIESVSQIVRLANYLEPFSTDTTGWRLAAARGISLDGTVIVGTGINPSGRIERSVATVPLIVPELGMLTELLPGLFLLGGLATRGRRSSRGSKA